MVQKVQIQGVPAVGGAILPLKVTDNGDGTGTLQVDTEITAAIDPTGLATSALQTALNALLGEVQASPTSNTVLDRLKALKTALDLIEGRTPAKGQAAKANSVPVVLPSDMGDLPITLDGEDVAVAGEAKPIGIEITRPANATPYSANDAIADNAPSITTHVLAGAARKNGGSGKIVRAVLKTDNVSWATAVRMVIYTAAPAGGFIADNAAFDAKYADKAAIVGTIRFPPPELLGAGAAGGIRAAAVEGLNIPYKTGAGVADLYFQLYIPSGTPTPASGQKFYPVVSVEQY